MSEVFVAGKFEGKDGEPRCGEHECKVTAGAQEMGRFAAHI